MEHQATSVWALVLLTAVLAALLGSTFTLSKLAEVGENWAQYHCLPQVMPFAWLWGHDTVANFNSCLGDEFMARAIAALGPVYGMLANFVGMLTTLTGVANSLRYTMGNMVRGINGLAYTLRSRLQAVLLQVRITFLRMRTLMDRVYGTFYAIIWMGTSAMAAGMNVGDSEVVKFMGEFCFAPDTPVRLADGRVVPIAEVRVGTALAGGPRVTSTFLFDGASTRVVEVATQEGAVRVSGAHRLWLDDGSSSGGRWVPAEEHPSARPAPPCARLVCLNTDTHWLRVGGAGGDALLAADYDESGAPEVEVAAQVAAERALNGGGRLQTGARPTSYALGVDPAAEVRLADNTWRAVCALRLGDRLCHGAGEVVGLVQEEASCVVALPGGGPRVAAAQLLWTGRVWERACAGGPTPLPLAVLAHVVTKNAGVVELRSAGGGGLTYFLRDYREAPLPELEAPYAAALEAVTSRPAGGMLPPTPPAGHPIGAC